MMLIQIAWLDQRTGQRWRAYGINLVMFQDDFVMLPGWFFEENAPVEQIAQEVGRLFQGGHGKPVPWVLFSKLWQSRRQPKLRDTWQGGNMDDGVFRNFPERVNGLPELIERTGELRLQSSTGLGQLNPLGAPFEKTNPHPIFKGFDVLRDRAWRYGEFFRSAREPAEPCCGFECAQSVERRALGPGWRNWHRLSFSKFIF
jgi:hypothetical protein